MKKLIFGSVVLILLPVVLCRHYLSWANLILAGMVIMITGYANLVFFRARCRLRRVLRRQGYTQKEIDEIWP